MTLESLYLYLQSNSAGIVVSLLFLPWIAWGGCKLIPGKREEPLILNVNLSMAIVSFLMAVGYLWHATHTRSLNQIIAKTDILLLTAPFYYLFLSLWLTQQRIPLSELRSYRIAQGFAFIGAGYLGISFLMSKFRLLVFSYMPFHYLVLLVFGLLGLLYLGYQRLIGQDKKPPHF